MERVTDIVSAVEAGNVTDDELAELHTELIELFDAVVAGDVEGIAANDVEVLSSIVDASELVGGVAAQRIEAASEAADKIAELEARLKPVSEPEDGEAVEAPEAEVEVEVSDEDIAEVVAEAEAAVEEAGEPVTAAVEVERPALAKLSAAQPAKRAPVVKARSRAKIYGATGELDGIEGIARATAEAYNGGVAGAYGNRVRVARIVGEYSADRVLAEMDGSSTEDKIAAVVAAGQNPDALVASGGYCAPTDVDYGLAQIAGTTRPVRDSLPAFQAARGGLRVAISPILADVVTSDDASDPDAAVSVWDADTDEDPDDDTKGIQVIPCPEFEEYLTAAIVKRLRVGNFGARAYPEKVQQFTELALAAHARVAETRLLDQIVTASTAVTVAQTFGAARDIAEAIKRAAAAYRSRHRAPNVVLRAMVPRWITTLGDVDLIRGLQADADFVRDGEAVFRAAIAVAGVNLTLYDDSPSTGDSQIFGAQAVGALNPFPDTVQWGLYDEGHHLFLDGGTLDLGIVRDSTLNSTNDFETFVETFEGLAPRGVESLWITSTVCPDGTSAAGIEDAVVCGS